MEIIFKHERYLFSQSQVWKPDTDIYESQDEVIIIIALAGMREEDINVILDGNRLKIWGRRPESAPSSVVRLHQMEIDHGEFEREFVITTPIKQDEVSATYKQGLLRIKLPKLVEISLLTPKNCIGAGK